MEKKNTVGNNIIKFRLKTGITQEELALRSGLSQGYINQLEHGKRNYTQKSLELIAGALSVPLIEFFKEENEQVSAVAEDVGIYKKKRSYKKELMPILNDLPEYIADHYLTLLKLELELMRKKKEEKPRGKYKN
ncbi:MAG: helix-turn-helix transcriptional regulator [Candidatus Brocadiaceae bacterium]|nr:helix-turn-helix transcriptional regulator [Candidatus Brocadiaceae bacterium]